LPKTDTSVAITPGAGYVSGNRVSLGFERIISVPTKPAYIYLDAKREGTPTGEQITTFNFVVSAEEKDDYIDTSTGKQIPHFVCKIAQVLEDGSVSDYRVMEEAKKQNEMLTQMLYLKGDVNSLIGKQIGDKRALLLESKQGDVLFSLKPKPTPGDIITDIDLSSMTVTFESGQASRLRNSSYGKVCQFEHYDDLKSGVDIFHRSIRFIPGMKLSTGLTTWKVVTKKTTTQLGFGLFALALNGVWAADFTDDINAVDDIAPIVNTALALNYSTTLLSDGEHVVRSKIVVPQSQSLKGNYVGVDSPYKTYHEFRGTNYGSNLMMRDNAQIEISSNSKVRQMALIYDEQQLIVTPDDNNADGYSSWIKYQPSICCKSAYNGVEVSDIVVLGAYDFFEAPYFEFDGARKNNLEKATFKNISGCVLNRGFYVDYATDVCFFDNIRFNPSSLLGMPNYYDGPDWEDYKRRIHTKLSYHFKMFEFNRADGGWITRCFAYAGRDFVLFRPETRGDGIGGSIRIAHCGADMFNAFMRSYNTTRGFGNAITDCWAVLGVNKVCFGGAPVSSRAGVVVLMGGEQQDNFHVEISQFKLSPYELDAGADPQFDGNTGPYEQPFSFASDATHCSIVVSNSHFDSITTYDVNDPISSLVKNITQGKDHLVSFSNIAVRGRGQQTSPYNVFHGSRRSEMTNRREQSHIESWLGGDAPTRPVRRAKGLDSGPEWTQPAEVNELYKHSEDGGKVTIWDAIDSEGERLAKLINLKHFTFLGRWDKGHIVLGSIHIWQDGKNIRAKDGEPIGQSDGNIIITVS
nr:hypothetical protein [Vibrio navarrensis]